MRLGADQRDRAREPAVRSVSHARSPANDAPTTTMRCMSPASRGDPTIAR